MMREQIKKYNQISYLVIIIILIVATDYVFRFWVRLSANFSCDEFSEHTRPIATWQLDMSRIPETIP